MAIDKDILLRRSQEAFDASTNYFDSNFRTKIDNAYRHLQNRHHEGSKYHKASYKYRSKGFRPKTRAFVRSSESKAMAAFFSNRDVVSVEAQNNQDPMQVASALINQELLNYRLTTTIPWFLICMGGVQDANVTGVVCSYQYWATETEKVLSHIVDESGTQFLDDDGNPLYEEQRRFVKDEPVIDLRPINNIRFSPSASWIDPVNTSPYFIDMIPMHINDVEEKMEEVDSKTGEPRWKKLTRGQLMSSRRNTDDSTDQVRRENAEDPYSINHSEANKDYTTVWVHRNFIKHKGKDYVFYTCGTEHLLTDPVPIEEIYWTGERPYVMGYSIIETHKCMPDSPVHLASGLQQEANEIRNQRLDNVKLVLNKRYFGRRGAQIDYQSLLRNAAGSVTLMNDPKSDVVPIDFQDVTSSSYAEQDRVNMDFDELTGAFSTSSVASNRQLNETVGGMSMLRAGGNEINEYSIRILSETWIEPLMRQLVKLEQKYETDQTVLSIAAEKAKIYQRFGDDVNLDELLNQSLTTTVNLGLDATDPMSRVGKLVFAITRVSEILANQSPGLNKEEAIKEIFGSLGYKDGSRFYDPSQAGPDPQMQQLQQQLQMMQQQLQMMQMELMNRAEDRKVKFEIAERDREAKLQQKQMDVQAKVAALAASQEEQEDKITADMIQTKFKEQSETRRSEAEIAKDIAIAAMKNDGERRPDAIAVSI